ncbi:MAG: GGDEF domain-containing protein [Candidatus Omnitrophica bacterium]|nr:GGDEF domain-containing protein [Candidatus Omnitrophota bacterium]
MGLGLWGPAWAVALSTAMTLAVFVMGQPQAFSGIFGWGYAGALAASPWVLAGERRRVGRIIRRYQQEQGARLARVSDASRALLSVQALNESQECRITQMADLYHVTKETSRALRMAELFRIFLVLAPRLLHVRGWRLIDLTPTPPTAFRAAAAADGSFQMASAGPLLPQEEGLVAQTASTSQVVRVAPPLCAIALAREQRPVAVLVAEDLPESEEAVLAIVANQLSLQCSRIILYEQVEAMAVTDALTGLFVRGHFMSRAREEIARCTRHGLVSVLLMVDLDWFKQKNDTYGHLVGDVVLQQVAKRLQQRLRDIDLLARFGGEEFILLLIETELAEAVPIADRIRQLVEEAPIRAYDETLQQTVSIGLAAYPTHASTLEELIDHADQALYAAKRSGRNRVVVWDQTAGTATQDA